jgi:hypothetical protein
MAANNLRQWQRIICRVAMMALAAAAGLPLDHHLSLLSPFFIATVFNIFESHRMCAVRSPCIYVFVS